jgi:hypothetical protein
VATGDSKETAPNKEQGAKSAENPAGDAEHYEVVSEYRIGEGQPPIFLIVAFAFIVIWAMVSWIPLFGY